LGIGAEKLFCKRSITKTGDNMPPYMFAGFCFLLFGLVSACFSYDYYKQRAVGWAVMWGLKAVAIFFLALLSFVL